MSNIDYIVEDDVFLDSIVSIERLDDASIGSFGNISYSGISIDGILIDIINFKGNVDVGRMPENENEMILKISKNHYAISEMQNEVLNKTFSFTNTASIVSSTYEPSELKVDDLGAKLTIVGIQYNDNNNDYNGKFYVSNQMFKRLRSNMNKNFSNMKILLNNKYVQYEVKTSDRVEKGKAVIDDELKYEFKNNSVLEKPIELTVSNIYYEQNLKLTISNTYTKSNFKRTVGLDKYDDNRYIIFINPEDFDLLYNKPSYQSSSFVKDVKQIDNTLKELEDMGIVAKKVTDFKMNEGEIYKRIIKIIKVIITIALIIVLFFISYLIIKIILKSRNIYYTTLRMLGATYRDVRRVLDIELFVNSTFSYFILMLFIYFTRVNWIKIEQIAKITKFLHLREYVLMYVVIILISRLISIRYARNIFKNTAISTYNEDV